VAQRKRPPASQSPGEAQSEGACVYRAVGQQLAPATRVPPSASAVGRSRTLTAGQPRPDVLRRVSEQTETPGEALLHLWTSATTYTPSGDYDPYLRWWTHRCAVQHLNRLLHPRPPLDGEEMSFRELSGYAALLWPVVQQLLAKVHPLTKNLLARPEEPSHLTWALEGVYVDTCITLYPSDQGRWLVALRAPLEPPNWVTVEKVTATVLDDAAWTIQRLYVAALDEVDVPAYADPAQQPSLCPQCRWWCGWDDRCGACYPGQIEDATPAWRKLAEAVPQLPTPGGENGESGIEPYLGQPATHAALVALKARWGQAPLQDALCLARNAAESGSLTIPDLLRLAGFSLSEAQMALPGIQEEQPLARVLRRVLGRRG